MASNKNIFKFDGYKLTNLSSIVPNTHHIEEIRRLKVDNSGALWIGTKSTGLHRFHDNELKSFTHIPQSNSISSNKITSILPDQNNLWVATDKGLNFVSSDFKFTNYLLPTEQNIEDDFITSLYHYSKNEIMIGSKTRLFLFNKTSKKFTRQIIMGSKKNYISHILIDDYGNTWLATGTGAYVKYRDSNKYQPFKPDFINFEIISMAADKHNIWFGSLFNGLLRYSIHDKTITKYLPIPKDNTSIAGKSIMKMLITKNNILYASSYHGGISNLNTDMFTFGFESNSQSSIYCIDTPVIYYITEKGEDIWLTTAKGAIIFNSVKKTCHSIKLNTTNKESFYIQPSIKDSLGRRWLSSNTGIHLYEPKTGDLISTVYKKGPWYVFALLEQTKGALLIGTSQGVFKYTDDYGIRPIHSDDTKLNSAFVSSFSKAAHGSTYIATGQGVAILDKDDRLSVYLKVQSQLPTDKISIVYMDKLDNLWVGTDGHGLFQFNSHGKLLQKLNQENGIDERITIKSILDDDNGNLWLGSDNGLIRLNTNNYIGHTFYKSDGLQSNYFNTNSSYKAPDGKLYFGGRNGLNAFYPEDIKLSTNPPNIVLTQLTRFGKVVQPGVENGGFIIDKPINDLDELILTHKDFVIGFEFAALDFADPSRNKYAFMMEGLDPDWNHVNADDRKISYSNLAAGDYVFRVKGSNKDGVWNKTGKSLKVTVLPAPWLTWWAFTLYVLTFFALLCGYLYRKNQANRQVTKMLRYEVDKQTKALQVQKQKVETLLERKNELFANVSHEFRTPLTLILGPINKLLKSQLAMDDIRSLQMVNRNANRLLTMIEQLLQLAKMSNQQEIVFIPQQVHTNIEILVASFQPLAETKNISLKLIQNDNVAISGTQDVIDIVLGNLISNAIKYTQDGGVVTVSSQKQDNYVTIAVTDDGCGLDEQQQVDIFNRFTRLDSHLDIAGVGIGLSVVEEILKVNNGSIQLASKVGKGSTFSVRFHCVELTSETPNVTSNKSLVNQLLKESSADELNNNEGIQFYGSKNNECILIIDDNLDMRIHLAETLKHQYYCITVDRGRVGIAQAIKLVPDIVICDVMMPEMDGFQVSRILRSDTRTSHIPLILLTALNDKKSRIKGWRENIDVYLTKPFDADELLIQLENVLVIRNILKKKAGASIKAGKMSMNSGLPKKDQVFVDKFIKLIEQMYSDPNFLRPQMASLMAVSDRQLQRKMQALIDKNPMNMLREYRLKKAAESLKDGYQVSITADGCGFNSVTYFSKCFKEQYGVSPKIYQQACNDRTE